MLDSYLAELYEVTTKALNQAVRRNRERFPEDFMFQLTPEESKELNRSQIVTGLQKHRDPRFQPYAFTEQGVAMLSSVLRSRRAALVNIAIMRAFVKLIISCGHLLSIRNVRIPMMPKGVEHLRCSTPFSI
jgi:hypothetical protein